MGREKKKAKMGRPPLKGARRRVEQICIRMTKIERKKIEAEARRRGISPCALLMEPWRK